MDCIKTVCEAAVTVQRLPFSDRLWVLEFAANSYHISLGALQISGTGD